jgi:hypothetical protein
VGSLVSFDWKLGVAVKSNKCEQLNTPFVAISLRVADTNNVVSDHSFELTIPEFYVCYASLPTKYGHNSIPLLPSTCLITTCTLLHEFYNSTTFAIILQVLLTTYVYI